MIEFEEVFISLSRLLIRDKHANFLETLMDYAVDNNLGFVFEDSEVRFRLNKKFYGDAYTPELDSIQDYLMCLIDSFWNDAVRRKRPPGSMSSYLSLTFSCLDVVVSLPVFLGDSDIGDNYVHFLLRKP